MDRRVNKYVLTVAKEIQNYLANHPNAADSAEGVMRWWLSQQRFEESVKTVQQALDLLVAQGAIDKAITQGCQTVYFNAGEHYGRENSARDNNASDNNAEGNNGKGTASKKLSSDSLN